MAQKTISFVDKHLFTIAAVAGTVAVSIAAFALAIFNPHIIMGVALTLLAIRIVDMVLNTKKVHIVLRPVDPASFDHLRQHLGTNTQAYL